MHISNCFCFVKFFILLRAIFRLVELTYTESVFAVCTSSTVFDIILFGDFKQYNPSFRKEIKDHNLTNHLKLFGFVEKVDEIMSCLDLIICPAEKEPFGRVLIEAMKNKVPIVASRSGAHQEIITNKKYGSLVEPDNFLEFVKHVKIKLVKNPSNLNRTFSYAIKKFNAEIHVKKIKKIYFELIKT